MGLDGEQWALWADRRSRLMELRRGWQVLEIFLEEVGPHRALNGFLEREGSVLCLGKRVSKV